MRREYPVIDIKRTGQVIKKVMKAKGLKVEDIQNFLQLGSRQGIYHWFEGQSLPTLDNIYALSELFHMPIDSLLCGNRKYVQVSYSDRSTRRLYAYYAILL